MSVVLQARNLTKRYGELEAVRGIDFYLSSGECLGILGPNGAGKSSTLRMIYSATPITSGSISIFGLDVQKQARQTKSLLGIVTQEDLLDLALNVVENLVAHAICYDIPLRLAKSKALDLLGFVGLVERKTDSVTSLSGGMRRRLVLARALINEPKIVVLDEPTTGLDIHSRRTFWDKLLTLKQQGTSMLLTSHHMDEVEELADRILIIDQGRIIAEGTPDTLREENRSRSLTEVFLRLTRAGGNA